MKDEELIKNALKIVQKKCPEAKDPKHKVFERFLGGTVVAVEFFEGEKKRWDYVYFDESGEPVHSTSFEAFVKSFAHHERTVMKSVAVWGGTLVTILVASITYLAASKAPIPESLSVALTALISGIVGFFGGSAATGRKKS